MTNFNKVLVSDFDGTIARHDFYKLVLESLLPPDTPDYWGDYQARRITHFEALRGLFAAIRAPESEVLAVVERMDVDPKLPAAIASLQSAGWNVVVTSAGCSWYIERLLRSMGVEIEIHSNPGRFVAGQGLLMEMPQDSRFRSPTLGVNKAEVVRHYLAEGMTVAFAGDSLPDVAPARLVNGELRFARSDLADVLRDEGLAYHSFDRWSEIAANLIERGV